MKIVYFVQKVQKNKRIYKLTQKRQEMRKCLMLTLVISK